MSEEIVIALIGTVPGTLTAVVALTSRPRPTPAGEAPRPSHNPLRRTEEPPSRLRFAVVMVAAALVTATAALGLLTVARAIRSNGATEVTVSGTSTWTNTGIDVRVGDEVEVTATGEVFHSTTRGLKAGPDGDRGNRNQSNVIRTSDHGALIGMITSEGEAFHVGSRATFTATRTGRLFLGVNDVGTDNNSGTFEAEVKVDSPN